MVVDFRIFKEGSKANNNPGSLESRVWLIEGSAWNNPMGAFPGKKSSGKTVSFFFFF